MSVTKTFKYDERYKETKAKHPQSRIKTKTTERLFSEIEDGEIIPNLKKVNRDPNTRRTQSHNQAKVSSQVTVLTSKI